MGPLSDLSGRQMLRTSLSAFDPKATWTQSRPINSSSLSGRSNILVYSKQVAGIVLFLQSGQPLVIVAVGGLNSRFPSSSIMKFA